MDMGDSDSEKKNLKRKTLRKDAVHSDTMEENVESSIAEDPSKQDFILDFNDICGSARHRKKTKECSKFTRTCQDFSTSSGNFSTECKSFPKKNDITFEVGAKLKVKDAHKWYDARIVDIDDQKSEIKIHYDHWNSRYDRWFPMSSNFLKAMGTDDLKRKLKTGKNFKVGDEVLAMWKDLNMYPAKVEKVYENGFCLVIFYDGFINKLSPTNMEPLPSKCAGRLKFPTLEEAKKLKRVGSAKGPNFDIFANEDIQGKTVKQSAYIEQYLEVVEILKICAPHQVASDVFDIPKKVAAKEFVIEEDHNHYKCIVKSCAKSFRKEQLLASHLKHYHNLNYHFSSSSEYCAASTSQKSGTESKGETVQSFLKDVQILQDIKKETEKMFQSEMKQGVQKEEVCHRKEGISLEKFKFKTDKKVKMSTRMEGRIHKEKKSSVKQGGKIIYKPEKKEDMEIEEKVSFKPLESCIPEDNSDCAKKDKESFEAIEKKEPGEDDMLQNDEQIPSQAMKRENKSKVLKQRTFLQTEKSGSRLKPALKPFPKPSVSKSGFKSRRVQTKHGGMAAPQRSSTRRVSLPPRFASDEICLMQKLGRYRKLSEKSTSPEKESVVSSVMNACSKESKVVNKMTSLSIKHHSQSVKQEKSHANDHTSCHEENEKELTDKKMPEVKSTIISRESKVTTIDPKYTSIEEDLDFLKGPAVAKKIPLKKLFDLHDPEKIERMITIASSSKRRSTVSSSAGLKPNVEASPAEADANQQQEKKKDSFQLTKELKKDKILQLKEPGAELKFGDSARLRTTIANSSSKTISESGSVPSTSKPEKNQTLANSLSDSVLKNKDSHSSAILVCSMSNSDSMETEKNPEPEEPNKLDVFLLSSASHLTSPLHNEAILEKETAAQSCESAMCSAREMCMREKSEKLATVGEKRLTSPLTVETGNATTDTPAVKRRRVLSPCTDEIPKKFFMSKTESPGINKDASFLEGWSKKGEMTSFSVSLNLVSPSSPADVVLQSHILVSLLCSIFEMLRSLKHEINLVSTTAHPELPLFQKPCAGAYDDNDMKDEMLRVESTSPELQDSEDIPVDKSALPSQNLIPLEDSYNLPEVDIWDRDTIITNDECESKNSKKFDGMDPASKVKNSGSDMMDVDDCTTADPILTGSGNAPNLARENYANVDTLQKRASESVITVSNEKDENVFNRNVKHDAQYISAMEVDVPKSSPLQPDVNTATLPTCASKSVTVDTVKILAIPSAVKEVDIVASVATTSNLDDGFTQVSNVPIVPPFVETSSSETPQESFMIENTDASSIQTYSDALSESAQQASTTSTDSTYNEMDNNVQMNKLTT